MSSTLAAAYDATGPAWRAGPGRYYDRLADVVCDACPVPLAGARTLDLGAGTGAASAAAARRGASVVALDFAVGMLAVSAAGRPPAVAGDALALPCASSSFDVVLAAFALNHLGDPVPGLREAVRVLRPGGGLVVSAFAAGDSHPAKAAVDAAAEAWGWEVPAWYRSVKRHAAPHLATPRRAAEAARSAGLAGAEVGRTAVAFPDFGADQLVAWRMGMAHLAPFVTTLAGPERAALAAEATARLGSHPPPLVASIIVVRWRRPPAGDRPGGIVEHALDQAAGGLRMR